MTALPHTARPMPLVALVTSAVVPARSAEVSA